MPLFFWKDNISSTSRGEIYFSPGGPPWPQISPWMWANTENMRYFEKWGDSREKKERQGKFMKTLPFSTLFTTKTLMILTLVNLEKSELQILKFANSSLFDTFIYVHKFTYHFVFRFLPPFFLFPSWFHYFKKTKIT